MTRDSWRHLTPEWDSDFLDGPLNEAKQRDMLAADVTFALRWVDTMIELVANHLPADEFVAKRMAALKDWERARKREQKAIHYRYDPLRRPKRLVERDTERARSELTSERIADLRAQIDRARADLVKEQDHTTPQRPTTRTSPRRVPSTPTHRQATLHPGLPNIDADLLRSITDLAPEMDLATTPDDDLRTIWTERWPGMSAALIDSLIDDLNATAQPSTDTHQ